VPPIVDEAIEVGGKAVWMQLGIINNEAAQKAKEAGLTVVRNKCIVVEHKRLKAARSGKILGKGVRVSRNRTTVELKDG